jgi:hypothetical protein
MSNIAFVAATIPHTAVAPIGYFEFGVTLSADGRLNPSTNGFGNSNGDMVVSVGSNLASARCCKPPAATRRL